MNGDFVLLTEKEAIWAEMLMEVLRDNGVPCASVPVHGAGFTMKTGTPERLQVFVPPLYADRAQELCEELFSAEELSEDLFSGEEAQE